MADRYIIYARKSTDETDRQVRSIDDQLAELRTFARKENLEIVDELIESRTARKPGRPVFADLIQRIQKGEANGILAWHPDRLSRNSVDGGQIIWLLDQGPLERLKFCTFWFESTPQGKLMLSIAFGMSKYYVDKLSEDVKRGLWNKVRAGLWPQRAPVGYLNHSATGGLLVDSIRAPLVRLAFERYATGTIGLTELQEAMRSAGLTTLAGNPLSRTQLHRMLQNPVYLGLLRYKGELFEGKHEPLVTTAVFDLVASIIGRRGSKRPTLKSFPYRQLIVCGECGRMLTTATHKRHNYLRCSKHRNRCSQPYVREEVS